MVLRGRTGCGSEAAEREQQRRAERTAVGGGDAEVDDDAVGGAPPGGGRRQHDAIAEDLHDRVRCRALFATHYHQLMDLAGPGRGILNCRVAVREWGDEIVFLHRIETGGTDRSYGLHVARLAGIPKPVIERARRVLDELDAEGADVRSSLVQARERQRPGLKQKELFAPPPDPIVEELRKLELDDVSPRQALELLRQWQDRSKGE